MTCYLAFLDLAGLAARVALGLAALAGWALAGFLALGMTDVSAMGSFTGGS